MLSGVKHGVKAPRIHEGNDNQNKTRRKIASVGPDATSDNVNGVTSLGNTLAAPEKHECRGNTCLGLPLLSLQPENLKVET